MVFSWFPMLFDRQMHGFWTANSRSGRAGRNRPRMHILVRTSPIWECKKHFFPPPAAPYRVSYIIYLYVCPCVCPCVCRTAKCTWAALPRWTQSGSRGAKKPTFGLTSMDQNPTRIRSFRRPNRAKLLFSEVWSCFYHGFW